MGSHIITYTLLSGCSDTALITVNAASANITPAGSLILCAGGSIMLTANNSVSYLWSPGQETNQSITVNQPGSYSVTVTDGKGCKATANTTITQATPIVTTGSQTNVSCNGGSNGSATIVASGGTGSYSYLWSPSGGTEATATGLGVGNYTVTITDANLCTTTKEFIITQPDALSASVTAQTNVDCHGNSTGSVTVAGSGGTAPYSYTLNASTPNLSTTGTFTSLMAGTYTITVSDAHNCATTVPVMITEPAAVLAPVVNVTYNCGSSILSTTATGTLLWSTGATTSSITVNESGSYSVSLTNASGCTGTSGPIAVTVNMVPAKPVITAGGPTTFCKGGSVVLSAPASDAYMWSNGATTPSITVTQSGSFTVTVTNASGCSSPASKVKVVTVNTLPAQPSITVSSNSFCNAITLTGGFTLSGPFSYQWIYNNAPFASTGSLSLGNANGDGTYSLFVTDANGCRSATAAAYTYSKQNLLNNYTIVASKTVSLGESNNVASGSVGITTSTGTSRFGINSSVASPGTFVKAPVINVTNPVNIPNKVYSVAALTVPAMQFNTTNTNNLPSYTASQNAVVTLNGSYANVNLQKGANVTLTGSVFATITVGEGATVTFTSASVDLAILKVGASDNKVISKVRFTAGSTTVRVSKYVSVQENCQINPDNRQVTFYIGNATYSDDKFEVNGGNTQVIANVVVPDGKVSVAGDNSLVTSLTGLYVAGEVTSGRNVTWNSYTCSGNMSMSSLMDVGSAGIVNASATERITEKFNVKVLPNPSSSHFTFRIESSRETLVTIRITNSLGQIVDGVSGVSANSTISLGSKLHGGIYVAEVIQGSERKVFKVIKLD